MSDELISVADYYRKFINSKVNLLESEKQCCPFHIEDTPSFSYDRKSGTCSCFGACHFYGKDAIFLHQKNYKLHSSQDAENSLRAILGKPKRKVNSIQELKEQVFIDDEKLELNRVYNLCLFHANKVDRWLQMDYAMSIYPVDFIRLKDLLLEWGVKYE